jgi:hypothetical protein
VSIAKTTIDDTALPDYAARVIEKYAGVLAAADVFTPSTTLPVMQLARRDRGHGSWVHP